MSAASDVLRGLEILVKGHGACDVSAEHDKIWAEGPPPLGLSDKELMELLDLGWCWDADCESWRIYV